MNTAKYPLLIQGFFSTPNGSPQTLTAIAPSTRISWTNTIPQSRGDLVALDIVLTGDSLLTTYSQQGIFSLVVGGVQVIQNGQLTNYIVLANPRSYELLQLRQAPGQTISLNVNSSAVCLVGVVVHCYFENECFTPEILAARNKSLLKQRVLQFTADFNGGAKLVTSETFTIPKTMGNVVGIQFLTYDEAGGNDIAKCIFTVSMGGTDVIKDAAGATFLPCSGRPGLIFPILIRGGETFVITGNTSAVALGDPVAFAVKVYFDEDVEGTKIYPLKNV